MFKPAAKPERVTRIWAVLAMPDRQSARMVVWPIEYCLRLQADAMCAAGVSIIDWLRRRREGTDAAFDAFERLIACRDWAEAASIQQEWLSGAMQRLGSDIEAVTDQVLVVSREAANLAQAAAQTGADATAGSAAWEVEMSAAATGAPPQAAGRIPAAKPVEALVERG